MQLQSTLAYLKSPPPEYQQAPFDFIGALDKIRDDVNANKFKNEYDFEYAVQKAIQGTHDAHVALAYGILSIFVFGAPYGLVSVSKDGVEVPQIYVVGA